VLTGACVAVVSGLLTGGFLRPDLRPDLRTDDRPMGPQIIAGRGGERTAGGPVDEGAPYTVAAYVGGPPEYVFGSDAERAQAPLIADAPEAAALPEAAANDEAPSGPAWFTTAGYADDGAPEVIYPSLDGGQAQDGLDLLPPPSDSDIAG
jgi:hypothetical protein